MPLQSLHPIYVNFGVPQQDTSRVRVGGTVRITADELSGTAFTGRVTAVDSVIDQATRNVQVQATVPNPDGKLRPGMFVQTAIATGATRSVVSLPASAISYAPFGDSVYVVADLKGPDGKQPIAASRQQFVKVGATRGDQVAVLSGVNAGDEVVTSGVFKLRNGAAVQVEQQRAAGEQPRAEAGGQLRRALRARAQLPTTKGPTTKALPTPNCQPCRQGLLGVSDVPNQRLGIGNWECLGRWSLGSWSVDTLATQTGSLMRFTDLFVKRPVLRSSSTWSS